VLYGELYRIFNDFDLFVKMIFLGEHPTFYRHTADVTDYDTLKSLVEEIETKLGSIDRVYHAAGIMPLGRILDMELQPQGGRLVEIQFDQSDYHIRMGPSRSGFRRRTLSV